MKIRRPIYLPWNVASGATSSNTLVKVLFAMNGLPVTDGAGAEEADGFNIELGTDDSDIDDMDIGLVEFIMPCSSKDKGIGITILGFCRQKADVLNTLMEDQERIEPEGQRAKVHHA